MNNYLIFDTPVLLLLLLSYLYEWPIPVIIISSVILITTVFLLTFPRTRIGLAISGGFYISMITLKGAIIYFIGTVVSQGLYVYLFWLNDWYVGIIIVVFYVIAVIRMILLNKTEGKMAALLFCLTKMIKHATTQLFGGRK